MKNKGFRAYLIISLMLVSLSVIAQPRNSSSLREKINFNEGWRFLLADEPNASKPDFDDSGWRSLDLPHDWSIEGTFSESNPATTGGGALPGGFGWYRKTFSIKKPQAGKQIYIDFDGVYRNSEVWINGHYLGKRPYGYSSFRYDLTPYIRINENNVLAVRVDNSKQPNSRWYSGSGIYRNVWLVLTGSVAIDHWGTYVTTPDVSEESAVVNIQATVRNHTGNSVKISHRSIILDNDNNVVAQTEPVQAEQPDSLHVYYQEIRMLQPRLWSDKSPYLYKIITFVEQKGKVVDTYETPLGLRKFEFDPEKGFILNGDFVKIRGVCNHHDLGCLGSAINTRALERQLELLKEMGCNGIRTSHNPPAPELLDLCDKMGFIVMDEAFDMWKKNKTANDYGLDFDEWYKRDLEDMVLRDRNHPSVFIWSIGNEIIEQWDSTGTPLATQLASVVRQLDPTRPITSACNDPAPWNNIIKSGALDLVGYNYKLNTFAEFPKTFPGQKFIASETTSALASRGSYDFPADSVRRWPVKWDVPFNEGNPDFTCSSYDNCSTPWGSTHEETWKIMRSHDFLSGLYIWTGFDYLGEPTPYNWPAHSSYFGILDLCGFPKDCYYMYQSEWTKKPMLHLMPHWNWKEGQLIDVWVYTNCLEAELFLNGTSLGTKRKENGELHLSWKVPFEAGNIKAIGRTRGQTLVQKEVTTAGKPARIVLISDRTILKADGTDLSFCTVKIVDENNNMVPQADQTVKFNVEGPAIIAGVDNGNQISLEPFKSDTRKAFNGMCLLVVQAGKSPGPIKITATSENLESAVVTLESK
ncbi:MAG: DUF4982 domain-containing protein [Bacteroidales bacterium]|nr:DUF4982 domain-containing protein [Bacteroidales bacterium]